MTLNPNPEYPTGGCYLLEPHRGGALDRREFRGCLEHIASGDGFEVPSFELIAVLARQVLTTEVR